jgi:N-acetylmuramoyl-L-alanine amidase
VTRTALDRAIPAAIAVAAGLVAFVMVLAVLAFMPVRAAAEPAEVPVVNAARIAGDATRSRFIADLTAPVSYNVYVIASPYRVIVDLPEVAFQLPPGLGSKGRGLVTAYRYGRLEAGRSRIVMDVTGPVLIEKAFVVPPEAGQPARMVVDLIATDAQTLATRLAPAPEVAAAAVPAPAPETSPEPAPEAHPAGVPEDQVAAANPHPAETPVTDPPAQTTVIEAIGGSIPRPASAPAAPESPKSTESSASPAEEIAALPMTLPAAEGASATPAPLKPEREISSGRKVIVLDPGHGGIDPGASGAKGTLEKDVVLALALAMRDAIAATGRYEVRLTRESDVFISLAERVRFARKNRADLFIALHADSLRGPTVRGATVYTLSEKASDREAEALAEKENRADVIAGVDLGGDSEEIAGILIDLAQRETKNASVSVAKKIVDELEGVTGLTGQPHRSAGFRVLRAPDVPSVLLEAGYLSSKQDEALLTSPEWRTEVAGALVEALDAYFGQTVAQER